MDDTVDVETFIRAIEERRALWDPSSDEYRDKTVRRTQWSEVYTACYPDFEEMDSKQKANISKELQAKWKHLRDCYVRYLRNTRSNSGPGRKIVRRYIFAPYLDFLKAVINTPRSSGFTTRPALPENECFIKDEEEIEDDNDGYASSTENQEDSERTDPQAQQSREKIIFYKRKRTLENDTTTDIYNSCEHEEITTTHETADNSNDDMDFFRSLLPFVKSLPLHQKINFRTDVMEIAKQHAENSEKPQTPSTESSSSFSPFMNSSVPAPFYLPFVPVQPFPMQSLNVYQKPSFESALNAQNPPPSTNPSTVKI